MMVDALVRRPGSWLSRDPAPRIALSSRVRLARNLQSAPFPSQARPEERLAACAAVREACRRVPSLASAIFLDMGALDPMDKLVLKERHLISRELAEQGAGSGLIVAEDERTAIMINEEDHLRLQAMSPGDDLTAVWRRVDAADSELENRLDYAFSPRLGYLTACPSNVGTGLRASVMLHLPGLHLMNEAEPVMRGLARIGLAVRGLFGEGSQACGNLYQVSNQMTLGRAEEDIVAHLMHLVKEVTTHERHARARLIESRKPLLLDRIGRAYGILAHARVLPSDEMVELLSMLRLGVEYGLLTGLSVSDVNELLLTTQPGHLQKTAGRSLSPAERDEQRAGFVRERLAGVTNMAA
jgi:protein arginine kinase